MTSGIMSVGKSAMHRVAEAYVNDSYRHLITRLVILDPTLFKSKSDASFTLILLENANKQRGREKY
jgi:hypothetical protein